LIPFFFYHHPATQLVDNINSNQKHDSSLRKQIFSIYLLQEKKKKRRRRIRYLDWIQSGGPYVTETVPPLLFYLARPSVRSAPPYFLFYEKVACGSAEWSNKVVTRAADTSTQRAKMEIFTKNVREKKIRVKVLTIFFFKILWMKFLRTTF